MKEGGKRGGGKWCVKDTDSNDFLAKITLPLKWRRGWKYIQDDPHLSHYQYSIIKKCRSGGGGRENIGGPLPKLPKE